MEYLRNFRIRKRLLFILSIVSLCILVSCNSASSKIISTFPSSSSATAYDSSGIDPPDDTTLAAPNLADTAIQISDRTYYDFNLLVNPNRTGSTGNDYEIRNEQDYPRLDWIKKVRVALYQTDDYKRTFALAEQDRYQAYFDGEGNAIAVYETGLIAIL